MDAMEPQELFVWRERARARYVPEE
ncbi:MAG: GpE family phage tail protein [Betaproteobacteria bacterium]|nr:GpE family phage tail protein [Betaproteobacteria bacterium]